MRPIACDATLPHHHARRATRRPSASKRTPRQRPSKPHNVSQVEKE